MQINYMIFDTWENISNLSDRKEFIYYETLSGKIIAFNCSDLRRLFVTNTKLNILEAIAEILSEIEQALNTGITAGSITL